MKLLANDWQAILEVVYFLKITRLCASMSVLNEGKILKSSSFELNWTNHHIKLSHFFFLKTISCL